MSPELPTPDQISAWLRPRVRKPQPSWLARFLGEATEFRYGVGPPQRIESAFFRKHVLFRVSGEWGLLPFAALPGGSYGVFATDGLELILLSPGDRSLDGLLRSEARPLDEAPAAEFAQFVADVRLSRGMALRHTVVADSEALRSFGPAALGGEYVVNERELLRVKDQMIPPRIERSAGGWRMTFTTTYGWMHEQQELGIETIGFASDFSVTFGRRRVLSKRIFTRTPAIRY
jgi:hypothetical protein